MKFMAANIHLFYEYSKKKKNYFVLNAIFLTFAANIKLFYLFLSE